MNTRTIGTGVLAFALTLFTAIAFTGCSNAVSPAEVDGLNSGITARALAGIDGSGDLLTETITGALVIVDGQLAVPYQGNVYYIKGLSRLMASTPGFDEGATVTVTGGKSSILDKDVEGNSLFFGYYFKAETVTFDGQDYVV